MKYKTVYGMALILLLLFIGCGQDAASSATELSNHEAISSVTNMSTNDEYIRLLVSETYNSCTINYDYDKSGNIIQEICEYSEGDFYITSYAYADNGVLQHYEKRYTDNEESISELIEVDNYDVNGNLLSHIEYDYLGSTEREETYEYDNGREIKCIRTDYSDGQLIRNWTTVTTYSGNTAESITTSSNGDLVHRKVYTYEKNGSVLSVDFFDSENNWERTIWYTYNEEGNCISLEIVYSDNYASKWTNQITRVVENYDPDTECLISSYSYTNDDETFRTITERTPTGHLLHSTSYSKENDFIPEQEVYFTYSYDYDVQDRIIVEYQYEDGQLYCTYEYEYIKVG